MNNLDIFTLNCVICGGALKSLHCHYCAAQNFIDGPIAGATLDFIYGEKTYRLLISPNHKEILSTVGIDDLCDYYIHINLNDVSLPHNPPELLQYLTKILKFKIFE